jgi:TRAP-type C4-dicarboxylate transport system permease small subunit
MRKVNETGKTCRVLCRKYIAWMCRWTCLVAALFLVVMMLLTSLDVGLRYFGYPIKGSYDMVGLMGAVTVALSMAFTQLNNRQVATEFIGFIRSKFIQTVIRTSASLLSIGMFAVIAWQCSLLGAQLRAVGRVSDTMQIPLFPFPYVVAFGCAVNCLVLLVDLFYGLGGLESETDTTDG